MILVQSRLRPLNGNRIFMLIGLGAFFLALTGCDMFKEVSKAPSKVITPEKKDKISPQPEKMDTIQWVREDPVIETGDPFKAVEEATTLRKDTYRIAVLMPLYTSQASKIYENENLKRMLHFYFGMQMAGEEMNKGEPQIVFDVFDIESESDRLDKLIKSNALKSYDFIVGPYKTADLVTTAEWGSVNRIPIISPWNASSNIAEDNPNYVQLKPGLKNHAEFIADYIAENFPEGSVHLVAGENDSREISVLDFFANAASFNDNRMRGPTLKKMILSRKEESENSKMIQKALEGGKTKVFIVPYWSNWGFVLKFLNTLLSEKRETDQVFVFGLGNLLEAENISLNHFEQLNIRLSYFNYIDPEQSKVTNFRKEFFDTYKEPPFEDSFLGYDLVTWLSKALKQEGAQFLSAQMPVYSYGLFNSIELVPEYKQSQVSDDFKNYSYLENRSLKMIRVEGHQTKVISQESRF